MAITRQQDDIDLTPLPDDEIELLHMPARDHDERAYPLSPLAVAALLVGAAFLARRARHQRNGYEATALTPQRTQNGVDDGDVGDSDSLIDGSCPSKLVNATSGRYEGHGDHGNSDVGEIESQLLLLDEDAGDPDAEMEPFHRSVEPQALLLMPEEEPQALSFTPFKGKVAATMSPNERYDTSTESGMLILSKPDAAMSILDMD